MQPAASPEHGRPFRPPHPMAVALIERLCACAQPAAALVLDFAAGSGRNSNALERAGLHVLTIADAAASSAVPFAEISGPFAAILSTHGLLHGTIATIAANLADMAKLLQPGGALYATFGSVRDARYGIGQRIGDATFAPLAGDEAGVPHTFFDRETLVALLEQHFSIESLQERSVDDLAGSWAHHERPLSNAVHWFSIATVSETNR